MNSVTFREAQLVTGHVHGDNIALAERSLEHAAGQRIEEPPLQGPLERASPIYRIITLTDEEVFRRIAELDGYLAVTEPLQQPPQLDLDDLLDVLALQGVEEHDFVDA